MVHLLVKRILNVIKMHGTTIKKQEFYLRDYDYFTFHYLRNVISGVFWGKYKN